MGDDTMYPYVENPEAIGDPDQTPVVNLGPDLAAAMRAAGLVCQCGGMNGWHHAACPRCDGERIL